MTTYVLDPIEGRLLSPHDARSLVHGLYSHRWTACARRREPGPATYSRLWLMLNDYTGSKVSDREFARDYRRQCGKEPPRVLGETYGARERVEIAQHIEDLFRRGVPWPKFPASLVGREDFWFTPAPLDGRRPQTPRPRNDYCLRWDGMLWVPCRTIKERREAGYVGLLMRWPGTKPKSGEYLTTGDRARFAYRVAEIERFDEPRGARRYNCRIWCERGDPLLVPKTATVHEMRWDARPRRKVA